MNYPLIIIVPHLCFGKHFDFELILNTIIFKTGDIIKGKYTCGYIAIYEKI